MYLNIGRFKQFKYCASQSKVFCTVYIESDIPAFWKSIKGTENFLLHMVFKSLVEKYVLIQIDIVLFKRIISTKED